jgi:hypothetical protein
LSRTISRKSRSWWARLIGRACALAEPRYSSAGSRPVLVDFSPLALQLLPARFQSGQEFFQLRAFVLRRIVQVEHFAHLGKRKPQPLAPQNQFQSA